MSPRSLPPRAAGHRAPAAEFSSPARLLEAAGVLPAKSRGQNFLVQGAVADRIVALADLSTADAVLEIGPGLGILSERILAAGVSRLCLIELDSGLAGHLRRRFGSKAEVIEADFLQLDLARLNLPQRFKVIANLPFGTAAAILRRLGEWRERISRMVLMFQREVGARLRAGPGNPAYGALSALVALEWELGEHFVVRAGSFHPRPKVEAEVICFRPAKQPLPDKLRREVAEVIRAAFATRRKHLRNALAEGLRIAPRQAAEALAAAAIDPTERAEQLAVADFVRLARTLRAIQDLASQNDA